MNAPLLCNACEFARFEWKLLRTGTLGYTQDGSAFAIRGDAHRARGNYNVHDVLLTPTLVSEGNIGGMSLKS